MTEKKKQKERDIYKERGLPFAGALLKCLQQLSLDQISQESETPLGLPYKWQEPKYIGHHLLPPRSINKKLNQKQRQDLTQASQYRMQTP